MILGMNKHMKTIRLITVIFCTLAWVGSTALHAESCCEKAKKAGKACEHKCCIEAARNKKVCEKCNPKSDKKENKTK
jgi:hypothetical protein